MQRHSSSFSYNQICLPIFYFIPTFHYVGWIIIAAAERRSSMRKPPSLASLVRFAFVRRCILLCCLHASTSTVDQDTIAKHFHGGGLSRCLSWDLRGLENRLGPSDLIFDANEYRCLSMCVCSKLSNVTFAYLGCISKR